MDQVEAGVETVGEPQAPSMYACAVTPASAGCSPPLSSSLCIPAFIFPNLPLAKPSLSCLAVVRLRV